MVAAPVPTSPPSGSPTRAVVPLADKATDVPKTVPVDGGVRGDPFDHDPLANVYTVAAPAAPFAGSPIIATVPFEESATDVPNAPLPAGGFKVVPADHEPPLSV